MTERYFLGWVSHETGERQVGAVTLSEETAAALLARLKSEGSGYDYHAVPVSQLDAWRNPA